MSSTLSHIIASPTMRRLWVSLLVLFCLGSTRVTQAAIALLVPENTGVYRELFLELDSRLKAGGQDLVLVETDLGGKPSATISLRIAAGPKALDAALAATDTSPLLSLLNTRSDFELLLARHPVHPPVSALYYDPAPSRQLRLAKLLLPRLSRLGVLASPDRAAELTDVGREAEALGLHLSIQIVKDDAPLQPALLDLIGRSDALLALPDPAVINRQTLKTILLTAYRHERVLIGSSEPMVTSGSLATSYSTPAQLADEASRWLLMTSARKPMAWPAPAYPQDFSVAVNKQVARSLGLTVPDAFTLEQLLKKAPDKVPGVSP